MIWLVTFLKKNGFTHAKVDTSLLRKTLKNDILIICIYVDDIIFCYTNKTLCKEFSKMMHVEFEISMMGKLKKILRIQINKCKDRVMFINPNIPMNCWKFNLLDCKLMTTPMHPTCNLN